MKPASLVTKLQLCGLPTTARLLVGISGGRDSVALVHLLLSAGYTRLILCHVNHRLRGRASTADARFVERLAASHSLVYKGEAIDIAALAKTRRESVETTARHARYAFFARVARQTRCHTLLLGHHANDQVETFLFNLFRGSGTRGLGGMAVDNLRVLHTSLTPAPRAKPVSLRIVRPLLGIWREEIDAWVAQHRLRFREDESNASLDYTRNRIRHELLPLAKEVFGRDVTKALWRTADILREEESWMQKTSTSMTSQFTSQKTIHSHTMHSDQNAIKSSKPRRLFISSLASQPIALQRRQILAWLRESAIPDIGHREVELVRSLVSMHSSKINLPRRWHARRRAGEIFLEKSR